MQEIYYVKGDRGELDTSEDPRGTATIQSSFLDFAASLDYVISTSPFGTIRVPGGVLKSMLTSDIAIIDIKEYQIKHF